MITKVIWRNFRFKNNWRCHDNFYYYDDYVTWILIGTIICTPIVLILDLLFLPIEIVYLICYGIIEKMRYGSDKE